jgi:hypothetical protein
MKRLIYQVYVGKKSKLYDHCTASVKAYCKEQSIDYVCQTTPILFIKPDPFMTNRSHEATARLGYLPIYEKENAFVYLKTYDQVAIIDSDIWIRPGSPNIFSDIQLDVDFAGVVEREMPITPEYKNKIINYSRMQYSSIRNVDWKWNDAGGEFMNMGMMVMNKSISKYFNNETPAQFLKRPRFKPFVDGVGAWKWSTDQTLLNTWIKEESMKVQNLHWKWNGLYTANTKIKDCHFVHFFLKDKLPDHGENVDQLMADVQ